jgi:signal transduction histidine kinase/CheY-like chemotaxis protein
VSVLDGLSIRRKLTLMSMFIGCSTVLVACFVWRSYSSISFRETLFRDLDTMAQVVGSSCTAALRFREPDVAGQKLAVLGLQPSVRAASLFTTDGERIAEYLRPDDEQGAPSVSLPFAAPGRVIEGGVLRLYQTIEHRGEVVGTIAIDADTSELAAREAELLGVFVLVFALSIVLAALLSLRLQSMISRPIRALAATARRVYADKDYSIRAARSADDEIGFLTDSFNQMLGQIQARDAELGNSQANLENEVLARTAALRRLNRDFEKAMYEARAATAAKSEFLANMSHEIRTPMNGVMGMISLLLETRLTADQARYAQTAMGAADSLLGIINDILDFSKIEAGKLHLEKIEVDLYSIVEDAVELMAEPAEKKALELVCSIDPRTPEHVFGDPTRLRQIVTNLVGNAIKFTETGCVRVRVSPIGGDVRRRREKGGKERDERTLVRFAVEDSGIGIPRDRMSRLFQSFSQADGSTTREYGGTGLGLAICKQLVGLMEGEIGVESVDGEGSTFWFTAMLRNNEAAEGRSRVSEDVPRQRVLVVSASEAERELARGHLSNSGFDCDVFATPDEALVVLGASRADDYGLAFVARDPGHARLAARLRAKLAPVPVVLIASRCEIPEEESAEVQAILHRPLRATGLLSTVADILRPGGPDQRAEAAGADDLPRELRESLRVLLAEDNKINQLVAEKVMARVGYQCDIAQDGVEVLERIAASTYDVILMDCQMPRMDGFEATRRLRMLEREGGNRRHVTVVALTANAMKGDRERCLQSGMDDYLTKPLVPPDLVAKLDAITRHRAQGQVRRAESEALATAPTGEERSNATASSSTVLVRALSGFERRAYACLRDLRQSVAAQDLYTAESLANLLTGAAQTLDQDELMAGINELKTSIRAEDYALMDACLESLSKQLERCFRDFLV